MSDPDTRSVENLKIVLTGGAGLVGQNLIVRLRERGCRDLCILDKSAHNLAIARDLHPGIRAVETDLSRPGRWQDVFSDADIVITLHAQISSLAPEEFYRNNVTATENVLAAVPSSAYLIHVSSSVIESEADDHYTATKQRQEELVVASGLRYTVLRPTLMFGWFDRKHLGWLSRFMSITPVFPIPGDGEYLRQPLYAGNFSEIIIACMEKQPPPQVYNISGKEKILFIDIICAIKAAKGSRCILLKLPYRFFYFLLTVYAVFDRDPPFTTSQLEALVIDEVFEDIDWENIFGVNAIPFERAVRETFAHPVYSKVRLKF
ncbi:MAG: NAD(P)-dependent oxidoreductase [Halioglobus sp.]|nr:NAD(P)-dependent oxidoreductase [Halioglobus sp.]